MALNTFNTGDPTVLIDEQIGDAYPSVRLVAQNIAVIQHVSANMEPLFNIGENIGNLLLVITHVDELLVLNTNTTALLAVPGSVAASTAIIVEKAAQINADAIQIAADKEIIILRANQVEAAYSTIMPLVSIIEASRVQVQINEGIVATNTAAAVAANEQAQIALAALSTTGQLYADIASGRAAVADGAYFRVVGDMTSGVAAYVYRRETSTTQTLITVVAAKNAIALSPTITDPSVNKILTVNLSGETEIVPWDILVNYLQEVALVDRFPFYFDANGDYGTSPVNAVEAIPLDQPGIGVFSFKNESQTAYASVAFGQDAALFSAGSDTYGPGAGYTYEKVPPGRISVVAEAPETPLTMRYWLGENVDPNIGQRVAAHMSRMTGVLTTPESDAVKALYAGLWSSGWIKLCEGGTLWVGRAKNAADGRLNWGGPGSFTPVIIADSGAPNPETSFAGTVFNGSNALSTLFIPPVSALPKNSFWTWSDTTSGTGGARIASGNSILRNGPNRGANTATFYAGGPSLIATVNGQGGLIGYRRNNVNDVDVFRNGAKIGATVPNILTDTTGGSSPIFIGGVSGSGGLALPYIGTLEFQAFTPSDIPTDQQVTTLYNLLNTYRNAVGV